MSDFIDSSFSDLDEYYPGSKRKRKKAPEPKPVDVKTWDSLKFMKTLPNGTEVEMFTIGSLAQALNRPIITVRHWIKKGYIPASPYRLPTTTDRNGEERKGRRLYTRPMIEAVVEIFTKDGILDTDRVEWALHRSLSNEISEAWNKIRAEEMKPNN